MKQLLLACSPVGRLTALLLLLGLWLGTDPARAQTPAWQLALSGTSNQPTGGTSAATATAVNAAGDVFITGSFRGNVAFGNYTLATTGLIDDDVFVAKWSTANATWEWAVRGGGNGTDTGSGITIGSGGEVYVTGTFVNTSANGNGVLFGGVGLNGSGTAANKDAFVAKYNDGGTSGATLGWAQHGGGDGDDFGNAIAVSGPSVFITGSIDNNAANGNNVLFGTAALTGSGTVFNSDAILIKYTDNGSSATTAWARRGGGTGTDVGYGVAASGTGVYITGSFINDGSNTNLVNFSGASLVGSGPTSNFEMFLIKYADNGSSALLKWVQTGGGNGSDQGSAIALQGTSVYLTGNFTNNSTNANGVNFAGTALAGTGSSTNFDMFVARYTDNTTTAALGWVYHGGGTANDFGNGIAVSGIGVYVTGNYFNDNTNSRGVLFGSTGLTGTGTTANFDGFVVRYGDLGTLAGVTWTQHGGGTGADDSNGIAVNGTSLCVASATGSASGVATFGPQWQAPTSAAVLGTLQASTGTWLGADAPLLGGGYSRTNATATDAAGNVFVTGSYAGQVAFGNTVLTASNVQNIFVAKWSPVSGTWVWAMQGGGDGNDRGQAIAVSSGSVYITGHVENTAADVFNVRFGAAAVPGTGTAINTDVFVAKYTDNGTSATLAWVTADGGNGPDYGYGIAAVGSNLYVTGSSYNDITNGQAVTFGTHTSLGVATTAPSSDVLLACYHDLGSSVSATWAQVFGGTGTDEGSAVVARGSEIFLSGYYISNSANTTAAQFGSGIQMPGSGASINIEVFAAKMLDTGPFANYKWVQHGGGSGNDYGSGIAVSGSSVYVVGNYLNDAANSRSVLFGGQTLLCAGASLNDDAFLLKYTDNLNSATQVWVQQGGGSSSDGSTAVAVSGSQLYVTGYSGNSTGNGANVSFGGVPLAGTGSSSTYDAYVVKYTDNGATATANWAQHGGGNLDDQSNGIALAGSKVYIAGEVQPPATFGAFSLIAPSNGSRTNFLAQLLDVPVPILTSIVPNSGPLGTTTVLNGSNLTGTATITFAGASGNTVVSGFVVNAAGTQITGVVVPAGAVTGSVTVTTSGGVSNGVTFTVIPAPMLLSIVPNSGPVGTTTSLNGSNLTGTTVITFAGAVNNTVTAGYVVNAAGTQITGVVVPTGAATGSVTVTTGGGVSNGVTYTVVAPPTPVLINIIANSGPVGTTVILNGANLTGTSVVTFTGASGNTVTAGFVVDAAGMQINGVVVPSGATTGLVTVTSPNGTSNGILFTVTAPAPTLTNLNPASGPVGTVVTLTGTNFTGATGVSFNGTPAVTFSVSNATTATATVPVGASTGPVTITTPTGISNGLTFTVTVPVPAPTITSFTPGSGPVGTVVTLTGTNFIGTTGIGFNGTPAVTFNVVNATTATATVPAGATTGPLSISTPGGTAFSAASFTVTVPVPVLINIIANNGPVGSTVILNGVNFTGTSVVTFAGASGNTVTAGFVVDAPGMQITGVVVPSGAITGLVTVTSPNGTSNGIMFFVTVPAPTLTSLNPTSGPVGTVVTLTGTNFTGATGVSFNGTPAVTFSVTNATTATATVPVGASTGNVTITTPSGISNGVLFTVTPASFPDVVISTPGQTVSAGTYNSITVTPTGAGTLVGPVVVNSFVTVQGVFSTNCQPLTGNASFTLAAGGELIICTPAGISLNGATGAVQTTGLRSFSTDASYTYVGSVAQTTGSGLPAQVRNLTANNPAGLTLNQGLALTQLLRLPGAGNLALNGQALTLLSDATGTALVANEGTGLVLGGTAIVQRYLDPSLNAGLGYRHYSTPVSGATVASLTTPGFAPVVTAAYNTSATPGTTTPFPTVFGYDQARLATATNNLGAFDKGWVSPSTTGGALALGTGYTVNLAATEKVAFTGSLNSGNLALPLGRNTGPTAAASGWALVGNPYAAPLDWSLIAPADLVNLDASMYVFESSSQYAGSYRSFVNGIGASSLIASSQGFFVRVSTGQTSGSLTFRDSQRIGAYATQVAMHRGSADTRPQLTLRLQGPTLYDDLTVYTQAGATAGVDAQFDAGKLFNSTRLNLSAVAGGEELAIQGLPLLTQATVVPLTVRVPAAGGYALQLTQLLSMPVTTQIFLTDAGTGQRLDVRTLPASGYAFSLTAVQTTVAGRFSLNFMPNAAPLSNAPELALASVSLFPNPATGRTTVQLPAVAGATSATLVLTDILGRTVLTRHAALPATGREEVLDLRGLASGVYALRVTAGNAAAVRRLVVE